MEKTKNIGLNVTTPDDGQTYVKEWRKGLDGNTPGSNMVIIDGKLGDAVYTADEEISGEIDADYITRNEATTEIKKLLQASGTYAELKALKDSNALVPGSMYLLAGYKTKYRQPTTSVIKETSINDAGERLVLTAVSNNQFDLRCSSLDFPQDIITFDFDDALCEDGKTPRNGFILRRYDTKKNIDYPGDWRTMLWARYHPSTTQYIRNNVYCDYEVWSEGVSVDKNSGKIYKSSGEERLFVAHASGIPTSAGDGNHFTTIYYGLRGTTNAAPLIRDTSIWHGVDVTSCASLIADKSHIIDCPTFDLKNDIHDIHCEGTDPLSNNVWGRSASLKIGERCFNNTFYSTGRVIMSNSIFGSDCDYNTLLSPSFAGSYEVNLGSKCSSNYFCARVSATIIGSNCRDCKFINSVATTTFGVSFQTNTLLGQFLNTSFGDRVERNLFNNMMRCQLDNDIHSLSTNAPLNFIHIESNVCSKILDEVWQLYSKNIPQTITQGSKYTFVRWRDENNVEQTQIIP